MNVTVKCWKASKGLVSRSYTPGGGEGGYGLPYKKDGDAHRTF